MSRGLKDVREGPKYLEVSGPHPPAAPITGLAAQFLRHESVSYSHFHSPPWRLTFIFNIIHIWMVEDPPTKAASKSQLNALCQFHGLPESPSSPEGSRHSKGLSLLDLISTPVTSSWTQVFSKVLSTELPSPQAHTHKPTPTMTVPVHQLY